MAKGGLSKGGPFEREISVDLSLWLTDGERDDVMWRTSQSGGRATTRGQKGLLTAYQYSDLTFTDPIAQPFFDFFLVELKRGYTDKLDILNLIDMPKHRKTPTFLIDWWEKALYVNELAKRKAIIVIFKRDKRLKCVVISSKLFGLFQNNLTGEFPDHFIEYQGKHRLVICLFTDFFEWVTFEDIKYALETGMEFI